MVYNMSVHKKIESFNNLNQKVTNLNILQDFMDTISKSSSVDEKIDLIYVTYEEATALFENGQLEDAKTNMAYLYWRTLQ